MISTRLINSKFSFSWFFFIVLLVESERGLWWRCLCHNRSQWSYSYRDVHVLLRIIAYKRNMVEISPHNVSDGSIRCHECPSYVFDFYGLQRISQKHNCRVWILYCHTSAIVCSFLLHIIRCQKEKQKNSIDCAWCNTCDSAGQISQLRT